MYPYHNKAKKLIRDGHLTHWEIGVKWNQIDEALVLYFDNHRPIPIRPHRYAEYIDLLTESKSK